MKKNSFVFGIAFFCAVFVFSQNMPGGGFGQAQNKEQIPTVQIFTAEETLKYDIAYYGARVEPISSTVLYVPFGGTITKILVHEGDIIQKNTPLYTIVRATQASTGDYVPFTVHSTAAGIVSTVTINAGDEVKDGSSTMTIANVSLLKVMLSVSDKDMPSITYGLQCTVKNVPNVTGTVSKISILPDTKSGLFPVEITFQKPESLFIGKFITVEVPVNPVKGTFIPTTAIVSRYGKKFVWVINSEKKALMTEITLVDMKGETSLVTGLKSGVNIAVTNMRFLTQDAEVNPVPYKKTAK